MSKAALALKGAFMGIAEAIPGVSGGTIAFITGIYQELIETIKSFTPENIKLLFKDFPAFWKAINGNFLITLLVGMATGLVFGVLVITHLLETQQELLWSFFFGLVLASAIYLSRDIKWNVAKIVLLILGAIVSYFITTLAPASGSESPIYIFFAGCIAISALMLPGISGSFMLLLFGLYHTIMYTVKDLLSGNFNGSNLLITGSFALGALTGLFSFARILSYLFHHYAQLTMAFLIGILLGSLNKLWPWKLIDTALNKESGIVEQIGATAIPNADAYKILTESNISPFQYESFADPKMIPAILLFLAGMALVGLMSKLDKTQDS